MKLNPLHTHSLLRIVFLVSYVSAGIISVGVTPATADTVWSTGTEVTGITSASLLDGTNWSAGTPTKENPGTITDATITTTDAFYPVTNGTSVDITLAGATNLTLGGALIPFSNGTNGKGVFNLTLTGDAKLKVNGNFWNGNNDNGASPLDGEEWASTLTFEGNSETTVAGEAWLAMSVKTHVIVKDSAKIKATTNNSGIGWGGKQANSLLDMTGGEIDVVNWRLTSSSQPCVMNQSDGLVKTSGNFFVGIDGGTRKDVYYTLSDIGAVNVAGTFYNYSTTLVEGGTITTKNLTNTNDFTQSGGTVDVTGTLTNTGTMTVSGATATINTQYFTQNNGFTLSGGTLNVTGVTDATAFTFTNNGNFTMSGGEVNITNRAQMGTADNANAVFTMTGGTVNHTGERTLLSTKPTASTEINISGGTFTTAGTLYITDNDDATTTINVSGNGAVNAREVRLGQHGLATINLSENATWTTQYTATDGTKYAPFHLGYEDIHAHGVLNMSDDAQLTTGNFLMAYGYQNSGDKGGNATVTMTDNASLRVEGNFVPFEGFRVNGHTGNAYASLTMDGKSKLYVTGDFWGGSNNAGNYASPIEGKDYALELTFGGDSTTSVGEFWVAMSAKTHVTIKDNATVTSRTGNSGMCWGAGAAGSTLDILGGKLTAPTFYGGQVANATTNISGGEAEFENLYLNRNAGVTSVINVSGTGKMTVTASSTLASSGTGLLNITGGKASFTTLNVVATNGDYKGIGTGTVNLSGTGKLTASTVNMGGEAGSSANLNISGGTATIQNLYLGEKAGVANMTVSGGETTISNTARFGSDGAGPVTYTQTDGTVNVTATSAYFAYHNTGDVNINIAGGELNTGTGTLYVADADATTANINLSGTGKLTSKQVQLAQHGTAHVTMSGDSEWSAGNFYMAYNYDKSDNAVTTMTMTDNAKLNVSGDFVPFSGYKLKADGMHDGKGYVSLTMDGYSELTVNGKFWSGQNDVTNCATPLDGNEYAAEYIFKGNSKVNVNGEFWASMSAKSHIVVDENATVTTNSKLGIGWNVAGKNALMEVKGGTVNANSFVVSEGAGNPATLNQTGGIINTPTFTVTQADGTVNLTGGDLYTKSLTNKGTFNVAKGGRIQVGSLGATTGETLTISGTSPIEMNGDFVLDVFSLTDFDKINVADGAMNFGDNVGVILNIAESAGLESTGIYTITKDWATGIGEDVVQSMSVAVTGVDNFVGFMQGDGSILLGSANALPEPATWVLLCLGAVSVLFFRKR